jgi:iron complex outermembrane receptor protein
MLPPSSEQVEELIVTAQKREQKTLDVPIALTAYSGAMLDKLGVQEFDKLSAFVPGFQVQNQSPNNPGFVMRGITSDSGEATVEPRVSVFQDGVSISKSRGSYVELFDVQRIEVAKGPQSTLFGRGAMIGAVNIIQNKADPHALDWRVGAELGDHGYGLFEGMANVPLSDTFADPLRRPLQGARRRDRERAGRPNLGSTDTGAARLSFRWTPTDKLDADLILNYEADHPTGTAFKSNTFNPTNITTGQALGDRDPNSPAGLSSGYGFEGGAPWASSASCRARRPWSTTASTTPGACRRSPPPATSPATRCSIRTASRCRCSCSPRTRAARSTARNCA